MDEMEGCGWSFMTLQSERGAAVHEKVWGWNLFDNIRELRFQSRCQNRIRSRSPIIKLAIIYTTKNMMTIDDDAHINFQIISFHFFFLFCSSIGFGGGSLPYPSQYWSSFMMRCDVTFCVIIRVVSWNERPTTSHSIYTPHLSYPCIPQTLHHSPPSASKDRRRRLSLEPMTILKSIYHLHLISKVSWTSWSSSPPFSLSLSPSLPL